MTDEILCGQCGFTNPMALRNCADCGLVLDKRMWRFAAKVEKDYHGLGLARTRALVLQRERTLRLDMPDASDEAVGAHADQLRRRFRRVYGVLAARLAGFEVIVHTNGTRTETIPLPTPWIMQKEPNTAGLLGIVLILVVFFLAPLFWCLIRITS